MPKLIFQTRKNLHVLWFLFIKLNEKNKQKIK